MMPELVVKPVPVTVSRKAPEPATTVLGARLVTVGAGLGVAVTVKLLVLKAVPPEVETPTVPLTEPAGITKVSVVGLRTVNALAYTLPEVSPTYLTS